MRQQQYFATNVQDEVERKRLETGEGYLNPVTIRHIEMLGFAPGWKCLEVGAGTGSIAKWLAQRVGLNGKVVATDINPRFLQNLAIPNLEIRQHDIVRDNLETNEYNLAHCRNVLMHLKEYEKALKKMADAILPGGWLLIEETDFGTTLSNEITNPSAASICIANRISWDMMLKKGLGDPYFGRRVRSLVENLGFVEVENEGWTRIGRGGENQGQGGTAALRAVAKPLIDAKILTEQQVDENIRLSQDPSYYTIGATVFAAWGKKP